MPRNRRQEETFRRCCTPAPEMLRETSYADLTVRAVAARGQGIAPATAYTYFSVEEPPDRRGDLRPDPPGPVLHRRQRQPAQTACSRRCAAWPLVDRRRTRGGCRALPPRCSATTPACGPGARPHRRGDRHKRIKSALRPDADPQIVSALEMTSRRLHAGSGTLTYHRADRMTASSVWTEKSWMAVDRTARRIGPRDPCDYALTRICNTI